MIIIDIYELLDNPDFIADKDQPKVLNYIKGTNGSGKTTLVKSMVLNSEYTWYIKDKNKIIATANSKHGVIAVGKYNEDKGMGGCDTINGGMNYIKTLITLLSMTIFDIVFEGVIVSDIKTTFFDLIRWVRDINHSYFNIIPVVTVLNTQLNTCLKRIYARNGGKPIKEDMVINKYNNILRHMEYYQEFTEVKTLKINTEGSPYDIASFYIQQLNTIKKQHRSN